MENIYVVTDRLALRPMTLDDTENVVKWRNNPAVISNMFDKRLITKESHEKFFEEQIATGKNLQFIIVYDGRDIGIANLKNFDKEKSEAEFGIFIGEDDCRGKGIGTAVTRALVGIGFEEIKLKRIYLRVKSDNAAAISAYEKAGFKINNEKKEERVTFMIKDGRPEFNGIKIIDAYWEKRNLGVDAVEIEVEIGADASKLKEALKAQTADYAVLKLPSGRVDLYEVAAQEGYVYVETQFKMEADLRKEQSKPKLFERYFKEAEITVANSEEIERIIARVSDGEMFSTDRIALDSRFGKKVAGIRYANWMSDLKDKAGTVFYNVKIKGNEVGFGLVTDKGDFADAVLGGIYTEYEGKGLGILPIYADTDGPKKLGYKRVVTHLSSNNMPIVRLHIIFGYEMKEAQNVFIKHAK